MIGANERVRKLHQDWKVKMAACTDAGRRGRLSMANVVRPGLVKVSKNPTTNVQRRLAQKFQFPKGTLISDLVSF